MKTQVVSEEIRKNLLEGVQRVICSSSSEEAFTVTGIETFRQHRHVRREILFVLQGESSFLLNGKIYPALPGTVFLLNKWESHCVEYRTDDHDLLHLWIYFSSTGASASLFYVGCRGEFWPLGRYIHFDREFLYFINHRWDILDKSTDSPTISLMSSVINSLLEEFALRQFEQEHTSHYIGNDTDITVFLLNYIKTANGRNCSLEQLERLCGYSRFHMASLFKKRQGKTIGDYIAEVRLEFVEEAQRRGMKQKEIAGELGFASPASFCYWLHHFRRRISGKEK